MLIKKLEDSGEDTSIITKWYQKDTNAVPPVHVLQPISSLIPDYKAKVSEQSCICMLGVSILPLSTIFLFDFGIVLTVWNCLDSVELFQQCGIVPTVWNCSQQCGIFGFSFYYFIKYFQVQNTCTAPPFYLGGGI